MNKARKLHSASIDASDSERLAQECEERDDFIQAAQFYLKAKKPKSAIRVLERVPESQQDNSLYYHRMEESYTQLKDYKNAARHHLRWRIKSINEAASQKSWVSLRDRIQSLAHILQGPKSKWAVSFHAPKPAWEKMIKLINEREFAQLLNEKARAWILGYANYVLGDKEAAASYFEKAGDTKSAEMMKPKKR